MIPKGGRRVLAIAESFHPESDRPSVIAGLVMRLDLIIDGLTMGTILKGGNDATAEILKLYKSLKRNDINFLLINGSILSLYNMVDLDLLYSQSGIPIICTNSSGEHDLESNIRRRFPKDLAKLQAYRKLGRSQSVLLKTGKTIFVRQRGMTEDDARVILNRLTLQGNVPEPIRIARMIARALLEFSTDDRWSAQKANV
ncbi:MAG: DUF99 family protein [Thaumarchaeota archaeon]|nr:DUF99 family protein [Nitrososphaerota archaeon]